MAKVITTRAIVSFIFMVMISVAAVQLSIAAGSSGGGSRTTSPPAVQQEPAGEENVSPDCETLATRYDRIKCRLENGNTKPTTHESCRGLATERACQELYDKVYPCYSLSGREKDRCLRRTAGIETALSRVSDRAKMNNYALFVLYDLEEKVEEANEDGRISSEKAADAVFRIITAKRAILEGKSREEIRSKVAELKASWPAEVK